MTKEVRLEIFNYLFLIRMKLKDNALSLIKQMLDNPEKDWNKDLPILEFTEKDYAFAQSIINRRIGDINRRKEAFEWLDKFIEEWDRKPLGYSPHSNFYSRLKQHLTFKKRWTTEKIIEEELQEQFPYLEEWGCGNHLYDKVQRLVNTVTTIRSFKEQFNDQVAELKELNLEEEISKLKELGVEIGEGNE